MHPFRLVGFMLSLVLTFNLFGQSPRIRVAYVGGGFFQHVAMPDLFAGSLAEALGDQYEARSFICPASTLSHGGDRAYELQPEFKHALEFLPDIVIISPGWGDARSVDRLSDSGLLGGCLTLTSSFRGLPTRPRVLLLLPPPLSWRDTTGDPGGGISGSINSVMRDAAFRSGSEVVNLYNALLARPDCFGDSTYLSRQGWREVSRMLRDIIVSAQEEDFDLAARAGAAGDTTGYHGYMCLRFSFEGHEARIVRPKRAAAGHPWLWRARFWGHEPQTEIALLERGFHVAYCDVAELFGNAEAIGIWNRFYDMLVKAGMSRAPALEAFSRGGIYAYRWAAVNPGRVACVYADAPVLDVKSWPGGKGKGHGNPVEWERLQKDFGLKSDEEAMAFRGSPIDLVDEIVRGGYPMLHVCGDADVTVPIEENTLLFEKRVNDLGGSITVIRKPGVGHHPHSLANPWPIVDFILRATVNR